MKRLKQALPFLLAALILGPHARQVLQREPPAPVVVVARRADPIRDPLPATPRTWFQSIRARCAPTTVQLAVDLDRPPAGTVGTGYESACFAIAGKLPKARALIIGLPDEERLQAASVVFNVAQAMVEEGRESAAGPLMELVLEFWPNHYVALYEAGVTRFAAGDYTHARIYLARFLDVYVQNDQRADRARRMIREMEEK